jgi:hypothetical protein
MKRPQRKRGSRAFSPKPSYGVITIGPGRKISKVPRLKLAAGGTLGFVVLNNDVVTRTVWIDPEDTCDRRHFNKKKGSCDRHHYTSRLLMGPMRKVKVAAGSVGLLVQHIAPPRLHAPRTGPDKTRFEYTISMGNADGRKIFALDPEGEISPSA